ncbi:MAG: hybrid sensor histidine kinase/response regulator [Candidatus Riflebacteria bacterium]|nr:hybrid sensor histidine kinase/response regulator [Candidatus Riflebacteria bacterium]
MIAAKPVILIIDDIPSNIETCSRVLEANYTILGAVSGPDGIELAISENPDLILLDIMMPDMDGYEVCKKLKANKKTKRIPIIFVTAKTLEEDETRGLELGAIDYITKPISPPILKARVKNHVELRRQGEILSNLAKAGERAKTEFLNNITRGTQSPLASILDFTEMVFDSSRVIEQEKEYIKQVDQSSEKIVTLVADMMQLSQLVEGVVKFTQAPFSPSQLFTSLDTEFSAAANSRKIKLSFNIHPDVPKVLAGDQKLLYEAIKRLIDNSLNFMSAGAIEVTAHFHAENGLSIIVKDTGYGIPRDKLKTIKANLALAERQLDTNFARLGLGLTIVNKLLALCHGTISIESEEGKGTSVSLTFPYKYFSWLDKTIPDAIGVKKNPPPRSPIKGR